MINIHAYLLISEVEFLLNDISFYAGGVAG
jgi:hypothetical protein